MSIEIVPVRDRREVRAFIRLPGRLYRDAPNWVAPLLMDEAKRFDPRRNPFYEHADVQLFLALRDGTPVGRLSAHIDHLYNDFHGEKTGFFGFFECIHDADVTHALFEAAETWLRERGMERILGPFGFNTNGLAGLLVEDFRSPPALLMPYNPPYYSELIEESGYAKAKDLKAFRIEIDEAFRERMSQMIPRLEAISGRARKQGFTARPINLRDFTNEVRRLREIYNEAWERNWGFAPLTEREFMEEAKEMKRIVVPELAVIVERGEEPVGFGLALPDFHQALRPLRGRLLPFGIFRLLRAARTIDGLRLLTLGIKHRYRIRGVDALLYIELLKAGLALRQYTWCEFSWILEDNVLIIRAIELIGGRVSKVYRVYEKPLR
jgi:hypothetical protein